MYLRALFCFACLNCQLRKAFSSDSMGECSSGGVVADDHPRGKSMLQLVSTQKESSASNGHVELGGMELAGQGSETSGQKSAGSKIIVLGDSNAQMSCKDLERFCGGSSVVNMATGGSKAQHWVDGKCPFGDTKQGQKVTECPADAPCCDTTRIFDPKFGSGYTHAWLSIGGNDFVDSKPCGNIASATLQAKVEAVITKIRQAGPSNMKIVVTGYVNPCWTLGFDKYQCGNDPKIFKPLNDAIKAAVDSQILLGHNVVFFDASHVTGGSDTAFSPAVTHVDSIHLNSKGYCTMFSSPQLQSNFACSGTPCPTAQCLNVAEGYSKSDGCLAVTSTCVVLPTTTSCQNNDAAIQAVAAAGGINIHGCADIPASYCNSDDDNYKKAMNDYCPCVCNP